MKIRFLSFLIIIFAYLASCNCPQEQKEMAQPVFIQIDVQGMTCGGCERSINTAVMEMPGIDTVISSHINQYSLVLADTSQSNPDEIIAVIRDRGYQTGNWEIKILPDSLKNN